MQELNSSRQRVSLENNWYISQLLLSFFLLSCVDWHWICFLLATGTSAWARKQKWYTQSYEIRIDGQFSSYPFSKLTNCQWASAKGWIMFLTVKYFFSRQKSTQKNWCMKVMQMRYSRNLPLLVSSANLLVLPAHCNNLPFSWLLLGWSISE